MLRGGIMRRNSSFITKTLSMIVLVVLIMLNCGRIYEYLSPYIHQAQENIDQIANTTQEVETSSETEGELAGPYAVAWVKDGDTLTVIVDGTETTVRMIGVDTPESVNPDESKNTPEGKEASNFTKDLIPVGSNVWLEYDQGRTDKYDRTLAYVYLSDNKDISNTAQAVLLEAGMARCMPIEPNTRYRNEFAEIEQKAIENGSGFWAIDFWN